MLSKSLHSWDIFRTIQSLKRWFLECTIPYCRVRPYLTLEIQQSRTTYLSTKPRTHTDASPAKDKEELLGWLSTNNFESRQIKSLQACHSGTCNWLFAMHNFEEWLSSTTSKLLWCHGILTEVYSLRSLETLLTYRVQLALVNLSWRKSQGSSSTFLGFTNRYVKFAGHQVS
jgi:hypothetical protein